MKKLDLPDGAKVLVRLPNWLGDVVLCTPSIQALRRSRPDLKLTALCRGGATEIAASLPHFEGVLSSGKGGIAGMVSTAAEIADGRFAAALIFPKGFREALLATLAGIPFRVGLATDRRRLLLTHPVEFSKVDWSSHHAVQFSKVLSPLGIEIGGFRAEFPITTAESERAAEILANEGIMGGQYAVFHISASKFPRAWHARRFAEVAAVLKGEFGLSAVLVGGAADFDLHSEFKAGFHEAVDLSGKTTLREMAALAKAAALFIGNDSGPMHLASASGAKTVAIFGPGSPQKTSPYTDPASFRLVYSGLPCSPCRQSFFKDCKPSAEGKPPCLEAVLVGQVLEACREILSR